MYRIESLLAARQFVAPQIADHRVYFISNLSGHLSLYVMDEGGSVPEPLLPPHIALQNPHLVDGYAYVIFPALNKIMLMLDSDGDENYQPMLIPLDGGMPVPAFGDKLDGFKMSLTRADTENNIVYFMAESHTESVNVAYKANVADGTLEEIGRATHTQGPSGANSSNTAAVLIEQITFGDHVVRLWRQDEGIRLLLGAPLEEREGGSVLPLNNIGLTHFLPGDDAVICVTTLFDDAGGLAILKTDGSQDIQPITVAGVQHSGVGEMTDFAHVKGDTYRVHYNIDGVSWVYEGTLDIAARTLTVTNTLVGTGATANGVLESLYYDKAADRYALSFSAATSPSQLFTIEADRATIRQHTRERLLGIETAVLAAGEDASFDSWDDLRISARLYLPSPSLGFEGARPLVYYIHGGPQSQERPDFTWFSMPLIQFLTLNGFAVFVPNVRGSTGYGISYMKRIDRDWGGKDRLDHVHALTQVLVKDSRLDTTRAAVMGRSYGGYMTLTQATRHPDLWSAAVDMFGPYDLLTFTDRIPQTWKPYMALAVGDPVKDRDLLIERSPRTYVGQLTCPLLVIQGQNDPRVIERESRDVVEHLREAGKEVEYIVFSDEGHDVLKYANRVRCYTAITDFFRTHLKP